MLLRGGAKNPPVAFAIYAWYFALDFSTVRAGI